MGQKETLSSVHLYLTFGTFSPVEVFSLPARKMSARPLCHSVFTQSDAMSSSSETINSQTHLRAHYAPCTDVHIFLSPFIERRSNGNAV